MLSVQVSEEVIIRKSATSLRALPSASEVTFPGLYAWSPVQTTTVTAVLSIDRGAWAVWRNRRLTPAPLPAAWFRRASGSPLVYQVSDILTWLAAKRGDQLDTLTTWRLSLLHDFDTEVADLDEVRKLVRLYARVTGPVVGDVRFTREGFEAYLHSLVIAT